MTNLSTLLPNKNSSSKKGKLLTQRFSWAGFRGRGVGWKALLVNWLGNGLTLMGELGGFLTSIKAVSAPEVGGWSHFSLSAVDTASNGSKLEQTQAGCWKTFWKLPNHRATLPPGVCGVTQGQDNEWRGLADPQSPRDQPMLFLFLHRERSLEFVVFANTESNKHVTESHPQPHQPYDAGVLNPFGTKDWFCEKTAFPRTGGGEDSFRMIQVHYIYLLFISIIIASAPIQIIRH